MAGRSGKPAAPETKPYRVRAWIQGLRDGEKWPAAGETIQLPDDEAADYLALGYIEFADDEHDPAAVDVTTPPEITTPPAPTVPTPAPAEVTTPAPAETPAPAASTDTGQPATEADPAADATATQQAPTNTPKVAVKKTATAAK